MKKEKTYTEAEVSALVEEKLKAELKAYKESLDKENEGKLNAAKEEAIKLANMSDEERAIAELDKREKAFNDERKQYLDEKMEFEATKILAKENLPLTFAKLLAAEDGEGTAKNIEMFKNEFLKAVEDSLNERLKGATPKTNSVVENNDPFLMGFGM